MQQQTRPAEVTTAVADDTVTYKRLQNGSDVRGVAVAGVEGEDVTLTPTIAFFIGCAFADWLANRFQLPTSSLRVSIGRDPRISGPLLQTAMAAGLASKGASVARFGLATTPAMFMSCILPGHEYDGGVMITASHLPYNRNGFKFFTRDGSLEKGNISDLMLRAAGAAREAGVSSSGRYVDDAYVMAAALAVEPSSVPGVDFMPVYANHLRNIIKSGIDHPDNYDRPLEGFKIAVDPGNGGGGFLATDVLEPLGADVSGSQFLEPDGWFPNHVPNPEDKSAMKAGVEAVRMSQADLGIVLDTDVDRSAVVAADGQPINSNRYIALMATITLRKYPGTTIVTDSVTSNGLTEYISSLGGKHFRYRRGYKNVISKGIELNESGVDTQMMMETSGHGAMKENFYLDDGAYSALQIIIELVRRRLAGEGDLSVDLLSKLKEPLESEEFRLKLTVKDFKSEGDRILSAFHDWVLSGAGGASNWELEKENHEGWRVAVDEGDGRRGWLLLRSSLHDPLLVLNVESEVQGGVKGIVSKVREFFSQHSNFQADTSKLA
ncbi:hypothetical protein WJX72_011619 [[Myrmecia] bisecta]|uniref:phosphoglucomutase (alpha-D-glucose-1,6-bisphosphate-dependent) n=1 Tax=[Myrmecia] bisecta TaxID=41462 RepID=A0AAW1PHB2_9CHLO